MGKTRSPMVMKTELAQSYMAQARSSRRSRPNWLKKDMGSSLPGKEVKPTGTGGAVNRVAVGSGQQSALGPQEDALEREEAGSPVGNLLEEALPVAGQEAGEELRAQPRLIGREGGAPHPFHHLLPRVQDVRIGQQPNRLLAEAQRKQKGGVGLGIENQARLREAAQGLSEGRLSGHRHRHSMGGLLVVGGDLDRDLSPLGQGPGEPAEQPLMVGDPVQGGVGEDQIPGSLVGEARDVA